MTSSLRHGWYYRSVIVTLTALLLVLQVQIWVLPQGYRTTVALQQAVQAQLRQNQMALARNQRLYDEIAMIKHHPDALEYYARRDLGMIKSNEQFHMI